jgi:hypothetical protein
MIGQKYIDRLWANVAKRESGCWEWTGWATSKGYGVMQMGRNKRMRAHRLSWVIANGLIADGQMVCHRCDNPRCVNPSHLFVGTAQDNNSDMAKKGRLVRSFGERNGANVISAEVARSIYLDGREHRRIALEFGVSKALVAAIKQRKIWAHATERLGKLEPRKRGPKPRNLQTLTT